MKDKIEINKNTLIPVGLVIALISVTVTAVTWTSSVNARIGANEQAIQNERDSKTTLIQKIEALNNNLDQTNQNVIKLQTQLEERTK